MAMYVICLACPDECSCVEVEEKEIVVEEIKIEDPYPEPILQIIEI